MQSGASTSKGFTTQPLSQNYLKTVQIKTLFDWAITDLSSVMWRERTNAAAPKAHDMTLKEASHRTKPQAQQMMFNRAMEQEHHELKRLETGRSYLLRNMVTGIGIGHGPDFSHWPGCSVWAKAHKSKSGILVIQGVRIRAAEGHTTVDRARIHLVRTRTSHRLCYIDEQARPSLRERPANRSGNMCDHPFCMVPIKRLLALTGHALHREQTSIHAGAARGEASAIRIAEASR
jgi:hypothetical protein